MQAPAFGARLVHLAESPSTNDEARLLALDGAPEGTVVRADRQFAGRGRGGRAWASPAGGLWFSVVLRPAMPPERWGLVPLALGLGLADALRARGAPAGVKWPNDVEVAGRKVAGVLAEARPGQGGFLVAGIGLNANVRVANFPPEVRATAGTLLDHGGPHDLDALLRDLLLALEARYRAVEAGDLDRMLKEYAAVSTTLGRPVRPRAGPAGRAVGVRESGALVVLTEDGREVEVHADDVAVGP